MSNVIPRLLATSAFLCACAASAQQYPTKAISLIVPFAPGASADGIARLVGRELSQSLGQPVVVENKPGAGGALGLMALAKAAPDGYTIGMGATGAIVINPHLPDAPPLKPERDLVALAKVADIPLVFVTSSASGYGDLKSFLAAAKAKQGGLSYGTAGQYTSQHLSGELLASMSKSPLTPIPYKGSSPAVTDLLGNTLPAAMVDLTSAYQHVKAGKLVALGVTSPNRSKVAPEIPTIAEAGVPGYSSPAWMGMFLPVGVPEDVKAKLSAALQAIMAKSQVQTQIGSLSAEPTYLDSAGFSKLIQDESSKWAAVISRIPAPAK